MGQNCYGPRRETVRCADGKMRRAALRCYWDGREWCLYGDTYFSVPARIKYQSRTVTGFAWTDGESDSGRPRYGFTQNAETKNHRAELVWQKGGINAH